MSTIKVTNIQNAGATNVAMVLDTAGTVKAYSTISVGNVTPSASGAGITFPATASASSDPNTLDDYEEGTFTPSINNNGTFPSPGGSAVYSGRYTKIGNVVYVTADLNFNASGTNIAVGNWVQMSGLPFSSSVTPVGQGAGQSIPSVGQANRAFVWTQFATSTNFQIVITSLQGTVNYGNSIVVSFSYFI